MEKEGGKKQFSVAIIGCGNRGAEVYGRLLAQKKEEFRIVALCDCDESRLKKYGGIFSVPKEARYASAQEFFLQKRADVAVIATPDKTHVPLCLKALENGYDVLLEKPISSDKQELDALLAAQKKYGGKVAVCHVLRYSPAFMKLGELISSGKIGRLIDIQMTERVGYYHIAHSYVRGNWRNRRVADPLILAKCCHDLDLMQYYVGAKCEALSSFGSLAYFKAENKPEGAADRCFACKYRDTCTYSAHTIYVKSWKMLGSPENQWPYNVVTQVLPVTEEAIAEAVENGPYGRCVFACDNDLADHETVVMQFENGVIGTLNVTGFTHETGRHAAVHGTEGDIEFDQNRGFIRLTPFGKETVTYDICELIKDSVNKGNQTHGGGDYGLIEELYEILTGKGSGKTNLAESLESHYMGIAAEASRLAGGALQKVTRLEH